MVTQTQVADFTRKAKDIGVQFLGLCCGNRAHYTRTMAEALGRVTPSSRYNCSSNIVIIKYAIEIQL